MPLAPSLNVPPIPTVLFSHIHSLDPWECSLLSGIDLSQILHLDKYLQTNDVLIAVTDGGAHTSSNTGSFGWVITLDQGIVFARHKGTAPGHPMDSFRAEA